MNQPRERRDEGCCARDGEARDQADEQEERSGVEEREQRQGGVDRDPGVVRDQREDRNHEEHVERLEAVGGRQAVERAQPVRDVAGDREREVGVVRDREVVEELERPELQGEAEREVGGQDGGEQESLA